MSECFLYKIQHKILPIIYIGLTKDIQVRWRDHKNNSSNRLLKYYFSTLGVENFIFTTLAEGTRNHIEELEALAILEAKSVGRYIVCNILNGSVFTGESSQVGENHWNARFSEQDIINIRNIYAAGGITQKSIGEIYGVSNKVISKITTGCRWKTLEGSIAKNVHSNKVANRRKLTDEDVLTARNIAYNTFLEDGLVSMQNIADFYNVSKQSMRLLLIGKSYPLLPGPIIYKDYNVKP
jgi:hypothetical protein